MDRPTPLRYYFDDYALTYTEEGWALLHKESGLVGTDQFPDDVEKITYRGGNLLDFIQEAIKQGLGDRL